MIVPVLFNRREAICEGGVVSEEVISPATRAGIPPRRCSSFRETGLGGISYDVIALNFSHFPLRPSPSDRLALKAPWEYGEEFLRYKAAYCRKKRIECRYLFGEEDWATEQIIPGQWAGIPCRAGHAS